MNILIVCPHSSELVGAHPSFLPLGMAYIAAVLEADGHRVEVLDLSVEQYDALTFQKIVCRGYHRDEQPPGQWDAVGFTVVTPAARQVYRLARIVKQCSKAVILAGGPHVSALPDEALDQGIDMVIRGEGEETVREVCRALEQGDREAFKTMHGISYRNHQISQSAHNPPRAYIQNLDTLPFPARHLFPPLDSYKGQPILGARVPIGNLMTSRGCPYDCTFCYKAIFGRKYRARSIENIIQEWRQLVEQYHVKEMAISDDLFNANPARAIALCERIIQEKLTLPWSCPNGIRVDTATEELLNTMKAAGCYRVAFGVESGSQRILDALGKRVTLQQIETAFHHARRCGIKTTAFLMLGNVGDTKETMQQTIDFTIQLGPDFAQFTIATPYPGTALYDMLRQDGNLLIEDWDGYDKYDDAVFFEMDGMSKDLILTMQRKAYREFYLRPRYIAKKLLTPATYKHIGKSVKGLLKFVLK